MNLLERPIRLVVLALLLVAACSADSSEWEASGDIAFAVETVGTIDTTETGRAAKRLLRDAPKAETLKIYFRAEGQDPLSDPAEIPLYVLTYSGEDVAAAKLDDLNVWQTIELANGIEIESGLGRSLIIRGCTVHPGLCNRL